jgi:hypothetical protein
MENKKKKVFIGTPSYDGKLEAYYVNSLIETIKLSYEKNVDIITGWVSYDALVQRARNDTVAIALEIDCDVLFFIDQDIEWDPNWFYKLLDCEEDVIGGTYPKKTDTSLNYPIYNPDQNWSIQDNNLIEVHGLGTGFLKLSKKALQCLWDNSPEYIEPEKGMIPKRLIFNIGVSSEKYLVSEDIWACNILRQHGFKIWLDPSVSCAHIGPKKYVFNFKEYLEFLKNNPNVSNQNQNLNKDDDDTII